MTPTNIINTPPVQGKMEALALSTGGAATAQPTGGPKATAATPVAPPTGEVAATAMTTTLGTLPSMAEAKTQQATPMVTSAQGTLAH